MNHELNRWKIEETSSIPRLPVIVVLDNVRSAVNVGSIFRTADAFALQGIVICGISAKPPHADIRKAALGAEETVPWKYFDSTMEAIRSLKQHNYHIACLEQTSSSLPIQDFIGLNHGHHLALIVGNEVEGVHDELLPLCDSFMEIAQFGNKHSLNVAVATGIALWEINKKAPRIKRDALNNFL